MPLFGPPNVERLAARRDVDGLIKALAHKDLDVRRNAARALGQVADPRAVEPLIAVLRSDFHVRAEAVEALGELGDGRVVEPLIGLLGDGIGSVGTRAAEAVANIGRSDGRAAESLVGALEHDDWRVRERALEAVVTLGESAVEPLIRVLRGKDELVRTYAAQALGALGDRRAVDPLLAVLADSDSGVRERAAEALGQLRDGRAVEPLTALLGDEWIAVRHSAAEALRALGDPRAVEALARALGHPDREVRETTVAALAALGDSRAVEGLAAALKASLVREGIYRASGAELTDSYIEMDSPGPPTPRPPAESTLIGDALRGLVSKQQLDEIQSAVEADVGRELAVALAIRRLEEADSVAARTSAVRGLGRLGDPRAVAALAAVLKSPLHGLESRGRFFAPSSGEGDLRRAAVEALEQIGGAEAEQTLADYRAGEL